MKYICLQINVVFKGYVQHDEDAEPEPVYGGGGEGREGVSMFDSLNKRLLEAGLPRWNAGPYVVEPIVTVGFLVIGLLIGWRGLLFAGLLFCLSKWSMSGGRNPFAGFGQRGQRHGGIKRMKFPRQGGGQRLGR